MLNPVAHTDPIGTLLIPIISFVVTFTSGVRVPLIGWGKPTPVNPRNWTNYKVANVMVSIAGIAANLILDPSVPRPAAGFPNGSVYAPFKRTVKYSPILPSTGVVSP